jgi:hypothetical protein
MNKYTASNAQPILLEAREEVVRPVALHTEVHDLVLRTASGELRRQGLLVVQPLAENERAPEEQHDAIPGGGDGNGPSVPVRVDPVRNVVHSSPNLQIERALAPARSE